MQSCDTTDYTFVPEKFTIIKDSLGRELVNQCSRPSPEEASKFFNLSNSEVQVLHKNFKKIYKTKCTDKAYKGFTVSDTVPTVYQYVGVFMNDRKHIYINAFPEEMLSLLRHPWKQQPLIICDGSKHFWGVVFDLKTERFSDLYMNYSL
jgi:hypothetical protein